MIKEAILVLSKEEQLGQRCRTMLCAAGYTCSHQLVDVSFSRKALIDALTKRDGPRVVVAQFRMSPYTALDLLKDLQMASLLNRVDVATLAHDTTGEREFIRKGGAAFEIMEPARDLKQTIRSVLEKIRSRRESRRNRSRDVVAYLQTVTDEAEFRRFATDLFRELRYREVRQTRGLGESGEDIVFYELNRLGEIEFVGVQAKVGDIHADGSRKGNVTTLWLRTVEALNSKVEYGDTSYFLDKLVVLTSGKIDEAGRKKLEDFLRPTKYDKRVFFYDQVKVADLVAEHAPFLLLPTI